MRFIGFVFYLEGGGELSSVFQKAHRDRFQGLHVFQIIRMSTSGYCSHRISVKKFSYSQV